MAECYGTELAVAGTAPEGPADRLGIRVRLIVAVVTFYGAIACLGLIAVWRFQDI